MEESEKRLKILGEMYNELRSYRDKEFKTFIFTFPVLAIGIIPNIGKANLIAIIILTTIFGISMIRYLYKNHLRMLKIKEVIYNIQEKEDLNVELSVLQPNKWINKSTEKHLGTFSYMTILTFEIIATWTFYIWFFMNN